MPTVGSYFSSELGQTVYLARVSLADLRQVCFGEEVGPCTGHALFQPRATECRGVGGFQWNTPKSKMPKTITNHPALIIRK